MSTLQQLLHALLTNIYSNKLSNSKEENQHSWKYSGNVLNSQGNYSLKQIQSSLQMEIQIMGLVLKRVLIFRDKYQRQQKLLCEIITICVIKIAEEIGESVEMKFSLSTPFIKQQIEASVNSMDTSDFDQWLQAMKMVARLQGGMPPEFRRKLWLALSEKYLQTKNVCWEKEEEKCFSETYREDDEELGIQIVKDLHRTGSSLCSGPAGSINQAKLKKILLGYARWNPEVGYCQGFNMLGALILQVMDKNEIESMKVMIYLVEGVLPQGYFSGSLGGLQADMAVFRELMTTRLPKLAKHLQKLQGPLGEGSFEPPLTNVFTMQWFLTMFCTCLPINCVLRVWDLVLIEGSDVLLRTALSIWSILEERVMRIKSADDFYCKMGTLSGELLNGHLIDSNSLIERVVKLGPIPDLQKIRDKHLYNIAPWRDKKGLKLYYSDEEADSDDDSHLAVTTAWGIRGNRRGSSGPTSSSKSTTDNKDRLALDISILKKQYEKLRERQRQAHIILTTAVARQAVNASSSPSLQMNQLLLGRNAIVTNKGRRIGPPQGAIPPARKSPPMTMSRQIKKNETVRRNETEVAKRRKNVTRNKDIETPKQSESANSSLSSGSERAHNVTTSSKPRKRSESSSYSEDSDTSSTSTSLCDEENGSHDVFSSSVESSPLRKQKTPEIDTEKVPNDNDENESATKTIENYEFYIDSNIATSDNEIPTTSLSPTPFTFEDNLNDSKKNHLDVIIDEDSSTECDRFTKTTFEITKEISNETSKSKEHLDVFSIDPVEDISSESDSFSASVNNFSFISSSTEQKQQEQQQKHQNDYLSVSQSPLEITSTSQLSPIADISKYLSISSISPLKTPSLNFDYSNLITYKKENNEIDSEYKFRITDEGVTNEYFERVNLVERPKYLDLSYSFLNENKNVEKEETELEKSLNKISDKSSPTIDSLLKINSVQDPLENDSISEKLKSEEEISHLSEEISNENKIEDISQTTSTSFLIDEIEHETESITNKNFTIEKSFSFNKPISNEKIQIRPTSCPEAKVNNDENNRIPTDRVLKIIEENSLILHRILRKTISENNPNQNKENFNNNIYKDYSPGAELKSYFETSANSLPNEEISVHKSDVNIDKLSTHNEYSKLDEDLTKKTELNEKLDSVFQSKPTTTDIKNIPLRTDDNITDRLESIKNTIKSIDSLCEDRSSFRKEKCQRYIDSLFENSNDQFKIKNITPIIELEQNTYENDNTFGSSYMKSRYSRDFKREVSPRRRKDEDREEYESRVGRDKVAKYFNSSSPIDHSLNDIENLQKNSTDNDDKNITENEIKNKTSEIFKSDNDRFKDYDFDISDDNYTSTAASSFSNNDDEKSSQRSLIYKPGKLELRHTTVTCTFYDRYLSQKMERNVRAAKTISSTQQITKSSYDTLLKPITISTINDRNSKSTETSPSRNYLNSLTFSSSDTNSSKFLSDTNRHSYDNILSKLKPTSPNNEMHSLSSSSLSTKKKSHEYDLSLGLSYKDLSKDLPKS